MKQFKNLSKEDQKLIHNSFQENFFDLTSTEQRAFNDYCVGSLEENKLHIIIKYLERDLTKADNLNKYQAMILKLKPSENLISSYKIEKAAELKKLINEIRE